MAGPRYIADPAAERPAVALEDLTAIYHAPSGMTHLLAPPAPQILAALSGNAADAEEVLARIAQSFEVSADDAVAAIAARLDELVAAGLVRRA
jgi:PqqD family protein of HPr-rel-A system